MLLARARCSVCYFENTYRPSEIRDEEATSLMRRQNFERPKKKKEKKKRKKTWSHTRREKKNHDTSPKWDFTAAAQEAKRWFVFTAEDQDEMKAKLSGSWSRRDGWSHGGRRLWWLRVL